MKISTLRPGYLVVCRSSIRGNVTYTTTDLGTVATVEGEESRWQTDRLVRNKQEQERAVKARALARSALQSVCAHSDFGLLCQQEKGPQLDAAIAKAGAIIDEFNAGAELTRIAFNVMVGTVSPDDARAVRAINSEMRDLIEDMRIGMQTLNVDMVRKAANKATSVGRMLEPNAQEVVKKAIQLAREQAKEIVKAGEGAAIEIDNVVLQRMAEARTAFLDVEIEAAPIGEVEHVARPVDVQVGWDVTEEGAEYCADCGAEIIGYHACEGRPGEEDISEDMPEVSTPVLPTRQIDIN